MHSILKVATAAGLVGLVVLHPQSFDKIVSGVLGTFRSAIKVGEPS